MSFFTAVTDPDAYFERVFPDARTSTGLVIVLLYGAVYVGVLLLLGQVIGSASGLSAGEQGVLMGIVLFGGVLAAVFNVVVVAFIAALYHAGTALFGGTGSFSDTFVVAAWGLLPVGVGLVLGAVFFLVTFDASALAGGPESVARQVQRYQSNPIVLGISAVMGLWRVYIVGYGLKHARNVSAGEGLGVAAVVTLLALAIQFV